MLYSFIRIFLLYHYNQAVFAATPASIPRNGLVTAVTTIVVPLTAALTSYADGVSSTTVLKDTEYKLRKPAIRRRNKFSDLRKQLQRQNPPITTIIMTPAQTACGAFAVADNCLDRSSSEAMKKTYWPEKKLTVRLSTQCPVAIPG